MRLQQHEPFYVWHATNFAGPYTLIDSVYFPINTYTHLGANGNMLLNFTFCLIRMVVIQQALIYILILYRVFLWI